MFCKSLLIRLKNSIWDINELLASQAKIIVTFNLKDFPTSYLKQYGIIAMHPDNFLTQLISENQDMFLSAIKNTRSRLRNPEKSARQYLDILRNQGLNDVVNFLMSHITLL